MTYFYNDHTGLYVNESPPSPGYFLYEADLHLGLGWHAYGSLAEMQAGVKANGWPGPFLNGSGNTTGAAGQIQGEVAGTTQNAAKNAVTDIIGNVNAQSLILRVGEVLLGIVLIGVGLAKITGTDNIVSSAVKRLPV